MRDDGLQRISYSTHRSCKMTQLARQSVPVIESIQKWLVRLIQRLLKRAPALAIQLINVAFNWKGHLKQLLLVSAVQIVSVVLRNVRETLRCSFDDSIQRQLRARTYEEWRTAADVVEQREQLAGVQLSLSDHEFFAQLQERSDMYAHLQATGDEYGLMFHLRSELMRRQTGGAGYNRDGSTWLRKHAVARARIHAYQSAVCSALRYIASGVAPGSSHPGHRLAFINETRHAFGRTALLLSGGGAFGVKHIGVISALHREQLLPRIVCGTSAGSIVAAAVCSRPEVEVRAADLQPHAASRPTPEIGRSACPPFEQAPERTCRSHVLAGSLDMAD